MSNPPYTAQIWSSVSPEYKPPIKPFGPLYLNSNVVTSQTSLSDAGQNAYNQVCKQLSSSLQGYPNPAKTCSASVKVLLSGTIISNGTTSTISASGSGSSNQPSPYASLQDAYDNAYTNASDALTQTEGIVQHAVYHATTAVN